MERSLKPKGSILLDGREMESMSRQDVARRTGYVPQSNPWLTTVFDYEPPKEEA